MAIAETQLKYNGNRFIPAPLVTISEEQNITIDGNKLGHVFTITANGTLVAYMGSPNSSGTWHTADGYPPDESITEDKRLASILHKQDAIRKTLADQYKLLVIQPADGSGPWYCNPKIRSVEFEEGPWYDTCRYTIVFEADKVYATIVGLQDNSGDDYISSGGESWSITPGETTGTYNVEHTINANGLGVPTTGGTLARPGWLSAKIWCSGRMGYDSGIVGSSFLLITGLTPYNPVRNEDLNEVEGSYNITEGWLLAPTSAIENYSAAWAIVNDDNFATVNVNIRGTIRGLYTTLNNFSQQIPNASSYFHTVAISEGYSRATSVFPSTVFNTNPTTKTLDYNYQDGTLQYELSYNDGLYASGTQEEYSIEVSRNQEVYTTVSIQGTIFGRLLDNTYSIPDRFARAVSQWAVVEPLLYSRVSSYVSGLQSVPLTKSVTRNPMQGTIQYNAEFNDRDANGYNDVWTVSLRFDSNSGRKNVAINGQVQGLKTAEIGGWNNRWANAQSGWVIVEPLLYGRVSSVLPTAKEKAMSVNYEENPKEGTISYGREYNDRPNNTFEEEWSLQFNRSRRDGTTSCSVQGTVVGLMDSSEDADDKYSWAISGFQSVTGNFYTRATNFISSVYPSGTGLVNLPVTVVIGGNPVAGTINYSYEYDNVPIPTVSGALSQVVSIQDSWANDVTASFAIPFNQAGPIIQDMETTTAKRRVGTVEIVMPIGAAKPDRTQVDALIPSPTTGVKYIDENTEVWSSSTGRYTRSLGWVYTTSGYY